VIISITLFADLRKAGRSDRFEDAIDYRALKKEVLAAVEDSHFMLVEALAEQTAQICLRRPGVRGVRVRVDKPTALRYARSVAVEIIRRAAN
jgi:FolB domain-containing protein